MYSLYVGFFLLIILVTFLWLCMASNFSFIGKFVSLFAEPFKKSTKTEENKINE